MSRGRRSRCCQVLYALLDGNVIIQLDKSASNMNLRGSLIVSLIITFVIVAFVLDIEENGAMAKGGGRGGGGGRSSSSRGGGRSRGYGAAAASGSYGSSAGYKTPDHRLLLLLLLAPGIQPIWAKV